MFFLSRTVEFFTKMKDTSRCSRGLFLTSDTICGFFHFSVPIFCVNCLFELLYSSRFFILYFETECI